MLEEIIFKEKGREVLKVNQRSGNFRLIRYFLETFPYLKSGSLLALPTKEKEFVYFGMVIAIFYGEDEITCITQTSDFQVKYKGIKIAEILKKE